MFEKVSGEQIKKAIKETGLTQEEFAEKIGTIGSVIQNWIREIRTPKFKNLKKIAAATGKPLSYFLSGDGDAAIGDITGDNNIGHNNKGAVNYNNLLSYRDLLVKRLEGIEKNSESTKLNFNNLETQHKLLESKLDLLIEMFKNKK
jgi:transcriptional regulator with XRE-family HTH domain